MKFTIASFVRFHSNWRENYVSMQRGYLRLWGPQMQTQLPTFLHRVNPDGTFDSICLRCLHTIASAIREGDLADVERDHQCAPSALTTRLPKLRPN